MSIDIYGFMCRLHTSTRPICGTRQDLQLYVTCSLQGPHSPLPAWSPFPYPILPWVPNNFHLLDTLLSNVAMASRSLFPDSCWDQCKLCKESISCCSEKAPGRQTPTWCSLGEERALPCLRYPISVSAWGIPSFPAYTNAPYSPSQERGQSTCGTLYTTFIL